MRRTLLAFLVLLLPALADADRKKLLLYRKGSQLPAGTKVIEKSEMKMSSKNLELSVGDLRLAGSMSDWGSREVHGKQMTPDRVRYLLKRADSRKVFTIAGNKNVDEEGEALTGLPVILERSNGEWAARLEKGKSNAQQEEELAELEERWNTDDDRVMYGAKPRAIGESWRVDAADVPAFLGMADAVKGEVVLTLVGEKVLGDVRCARLKGKLDCTALMKGEGEDPDVKIKLEGDFEIVRSLVHYEDIAFDMSGKMTMLVEGPSPQGPLTMEGDGPFTMTGSLHIR